MPRPTRSVSFPVSGKLAQCFLFIGKFQSERIGTKLIDKHINAQFSDVQSNVISGGFSGMGAPIIFCRHHPLPSPVGKVRAGDAQQKAAKGDNEFVAICRNA